MTCSAGPISISLPRYMTAIRSASTHAMARSCVMNRYVRPRSPPRSTLSPTSPVLTQTRPGRAGPPGPGVTPRPPGDPRARAVAAGRLGGVPPREAGGGRRARRLERLEAPPTALVPRQLRPDEERLLHEGADRVLGVEG